MVYVNFEKKTSILFLPYYQIIDALFMGASYLLVHIVDFLLADLSKRVKMENYRLYYRDFDSR